MRAQSPAERAAKAYGISKKPHRAGHGSRPPDECIDCGVCEPECPAQAISADSEPGLDKWLNLNAEFAQTWPNIAVKRDPPADAAEFDGMPDKFERFFSSNPGQGDGGEAAGPALQSGARTETLHKPQG